MWLPKGNDLNKDLEAASRSRDFLAMSFLVRDLPPQVPNVIDRQPPCTYSKLAQSPSINLQ